MHHLMGYHSFLTCSSFVRYSPSPFRSSFQPHHSAEVSILRGNCSSQEMFSFSIGGSSGDLVAAGSKAQVLFWDLRKQKQVACLEECHMEDVTQVDYFIDCHYSLPNDNLWLIGGTNDGSLGYFPVNYNKSNGQSQPSSGVIGSASAALEGGHIGVVRSVWSPFGVGVNPTVKEGIFVWTGGEDGRLCCWSEGDASGKNRAWISTGLAMKTSKGSKQRRHRPY